jgi:hypothetical protein
MVYLDRGLTDKRHDLIGNDLVTAGTGTAERDAALAMLGELADRGRLIVGADKNHVTRDCLRHIRKMGITPYVTPYRETERRGSAIDGRTTRHLGHEISQRELKPVEQAFS